MDRKKFEEHVGGKVAYELFRDIESRLSRLKPNGAKNHKLAGLRTFFVGHIALYETRREKTHQRETIDSIRERDSKRYCKTIDYLVRARDEFGISF